MLTKSIDFYENLESMLIKALIKKFQYICTFNDCEVGNKLIGLIL